jgi:Flp pilus assembly protein TadB
MMGWLAAGGWASAALAAAVMGWLWEREKRKRERADARAAAYEDRNIRMAGQLASMAGTAKQQIDRLEKADDVHQQRHLETLAGIEQHLAAHPECADDFLIGVFRDLAAATAGAGEPVAVPGRAPAKVPSGGN